MLKTLQNRIRDIIEERDQGRWPKTQAMLGIVSKIYGAAMRLRAKFYAQGILTTHRLPCKVISIGNLTVGGTGKTPMTVYVARRLQQQRKKVVVISRGYKGAAEKDGGVVSDGQHILMGPEQAGDEPYMMAHQLLGIPVLVGRNRYQSGQRAIKEYNPDVIILDDGYQHLSLHRDLNILLLDARRPFGNMRLLPGGKLREPIVAAQRADVVVYSRAGEMPNLPVVIEDAACRQQYHSNHVSIFYQTGSSVHSSNIRSLCPIEAASLAGQPVFAFSGIADNDAFFQSLSRSGLLIKGVQSFDDHHVYQRTDLEAILRAKHEVHAQWIVTSEKDYYRLSARAEVLLPLIVAGIQIMVHDPMASFDRLISAL
ncbi:MAG: tetraacyldisaccharide 4'-kinase [Desulfobacteraceae bacterium]|nr:tetraacyldisaccharide 4'-kinase [Desulfobacteraceae bacterium]